MTRSYRKEALRPSVSITDPKAGLGVVYAEGAFPSVPTPRSTLQGESGVALVVDLALARRESDFALAFKGYFHAQSDGVYTFYLTSDDGSTLWIGDELLVDNGGFHSPRTVAGSIALKAGWHPIYIGYIQARGARVLSLEYRGPGIARCPVPGSALCHQNGD